MLCHTASEPVGVVHNSARPRPFTGPRIIRNLVGMMAIALTSLSASPIPARIVPDITDDYILAYRLRGYGRVFRSDRDGDFGEFVQIAEGGITILQGHPNDTLRIVRAPGHRRAEPHHAPTIAYLRAPEGLRVLDSQGPIGVIESDGPVGRMTIRGAVAFIGVRQAGAIRILASRREPTWTSIQIEEPFLRDDRQSLTSIHLAGLGLDTLDAPDVLFAQVVSASRLSRDEEGRFVSRGGIGQADSMLTLRRIHRLQASGAAIRGDWVATPPLTRPWNNVVIRATGATFNLGRSGLGDSFDLQAIRGDIDVDRVSMTSANRIRMLAVGGDIVAGRHGFGSRILAVSARSRRLAGEWTGGHVGAPDALYTALTVAVLSSSFPGEADIHLISGTNGINGRFFAGAQLGWLNEVIEPTFDGFVHRVNTRRHDDGYLRGEICAHILQKESVFPPHLRPEVWANNTMAIYTNMLDWIEGQEIASPAPAP